MDMNSRIAMFPGSFDPPTNGHIDIIRRSNALYDKVYVVVADNSSKKAMFTAAERVGLLEALVADMPNVEVLSWGGLTVDFARKHGVGVIVRGVRALTDFAYEFEIAETNRQLCPEIEVVFLPTNPKYFLLRSSMVKEVAFYGDEIKGMLPEIVSKALKQRVSEMRNQE